MALESRLVSRTIESAQTRVEGYNFDIRKRVVEYDDVINKQRETIYAERDKVLRNEDLTETVRGFVDAEIEALVDDQLSDANPEEWDWEGLAHEIAPDGARGRPTSRRRRWPTRRARGSPASTSQAAVDDALEEREQKYGEEVWAQVERLVLLRTIDQLWVDHLTELDDMRRGIGLRGYGGIDPLNEFKREAFKLYEELRGFISQQVANTIFKVQVTRRATTADVPDAPASAVHRDERRRKRVADRRDHAGGGRPRPLRWDIPRGCRRRCAGSQPVRPAAAARSGAPRSGTSAAAVLPGMAAQQRRGIQFQHGDQPEADDGNGRGSAAGAPASAAKLGRNDPCWCGSGKKFKRCHGA